MLTKPPKMFRRTRRIKKSPAGLTLVSASAAAGIGMTLTLNFDRNVDVTAIDVTQFTVNWPANSATFRGSSLSSVSGRTVLIAATNIGANTGPTPQLTATAATKIVATDGGSWV